MRIYIDDETNFITGSPGVRESVDRLVFRRGNTASIEVQFYRGGTIIERPPGATGSMSLKTIDDYDSDALVECLEWTKVGSGTDTYYVFYPNFNVEPLNEALGHNSAVKDKKYLDLMFEVEWADGESIGSTVPDDNNETIARVWNDINKGTSEAPTPGPDPYPTSDRIILHLSDVDGFTGVSGLSAVVTAGIPTNRLIAFTVDGKPFHAKLIEGDDETSLLTNPVYVKPDDHDESTNNRVWISHDQLDPDDNLIHYSPDISDTDDLGGVTTAGLPEGYAQHLGLNDLYILLAGDSATSLPWIKRPDDFDENTNARVWVKRIPSVIHDKSISSLMGGEAGDLDSIPTAFAAEGLIVEFTGSPKLARYRLETKAYADIDILSVSANAINTAGDLPPLNSVVEFETDDTLPAGLTENAFWYVVSVDTENDNFQVSDEHSGDPQAITSSGTGNHSFFVHDDPWWVRPRDYSESGMAWRLVGPEYTFPIEVLDNETLIENVRYYSGYSPISMLPHRVQFSLAEVGGSNIAVGLESDEVELLENETISFATRNTDTDLEEEAVVGRIFKGDELITDVQTAGGGKGLRVYVSGVVAPILGPTIGNRSPDTVVSSLRANAGADQTVIEGASVTLDSTGSTPNTGNISYLWEQTSGTAVTLSSTTTSSPTFTAPLVEEDTELIFLLTVTNSETEEETEDSVTITIEDFELVAVAGDDQAANSGDTVTLDSTGSTPITAGLVEYEWEQIWGPAVALSSESDANPTFVAPNDPRAYTFRLHVRNVTTNVVVTDDVIIDVSSLDSLIRYSIDESPTAADRNDGRILIGCENGIIYTSDDLIEWFKIDTGTDLDITGIATREDGRAVFTTDEGIYFSRDGISWSEVEDPYTGIDWNDVADSGTHFIAVNNDGRALRSANGQTWTEHLIRDASPFNQVATNDQQVMAVGAAGRIAFSEDSGSTWDYVDVGNQDIRGVAYSPELDVWALCGGSGFLRSVPGASFGEDIDDDLVSHDVVGAIFEDVNWDPENLAFLAVGFSKAYISYDGSTWSSIYSEIESPGTCYALSNLNGRFVVASSFYDQIFVLPEMPNPE